MSTLGYIRTLIDYNYALYGQVWDSIRHLTHEQFIFDAPTFDQDLLLHLWTG
jgi:hypothetical protein